MIEHGYDDQSLYALACSQAPFNHFEIAELRGKALIKLKISDISHSTAVHVYAVEIIKGALSGKIELINALYALEQLCADNDYRSDLYDFYLLYYAYSDLQKHKNQHHWDDATIDNIDEIVRKHFESFIKI